MATTQQRSKQRSKRETFRRATAADTAQRGPQSIDPQTRTVRAVIATDTPVIVTDWEAEELVAEVLAPSGMVEPPKMRLRVDHMNWSSRDVIGRVFDFAIGKSEIEATLQFSSADDVEQIWQRVSEGFLDSVSIGASYRMADTVRIEPGKSYRFNGVTYTAGEIPTLLVTKWTPSETSIVDVPADPRAVIRSARRTRSPTIGTRNKQGTQSNARLPYSGPTTTGEEMTVRHKRGESRTAAPSKSSGSKRTRGSAVSEPVGADDVIDSQIDDTAAFDADSDGDAETQRGDFLYNESRQRGPRTAEQTRVETQLAQMAERAKRVAGADATEDQIEAARMAERKRVSRIRELGADQPDELVTRAINDGLTPEQFGLAVLERIRGESAAHRTAQSGDGVDRAPAGHVRGALTVEALQSAVLHRAGHSLQNPAFATEAARAIFERNNLGWLYRMNAEISDRGNSDVERHAEMGRRYSTDSAARTCERLLENFSREGAPADVEEIVTRSFSNPYMPRVFGSIISVGLVSGYATYPDSTVGWTSEADWADFRNNQPIGIDATQSLRRHVRGAEAKEVDFADYGEAYAVVRYSGKFQLDEMDIIDDVVGMNQTMPQQMGIMAARLRPDLVYAILQSNPTLTDGVTLFNSSRGNALTTNPLSIAGLASAEAAMATRTATTKSNKPVAINLMAGHLIVPRAIRTTAKQIANSTLIVSGNTTDRGNLNPHDGEYKIYSDARLDIGVIDPRTDTSTTGNASTWYIAERDGSQTIQVGFRRGTGRAPQIRVRQLTQPGHFGLGWDVAHDIGAGVISPRGLVRNVAT